MAERDHPRSVRCPEHTQALPHHPLGILEPALFRVNLGDVETRDRRIPVVANAVEHLAGPFVVPLRDGPLAQGIRPYAEVVEDRTLPGELAELLPDIECPHGQRLVPEGSQRDTRTV